MSAERTIFSRLRACHAGELAAMESVYPVGMRQGAELIAERLSALEASDFPMSWISHRDGACRSYLLAFVSTTQLDVEPAQSVIYIDDLQVSEGHTNHLFPLLRLLARDLHALGLAGLPIEGVTRRSTYRLLCEHAALVEGLGWELELQHTYWDDKAEESLTWVRYVPVVRDGRVPGRAGSSGDESAREGARRRLRHDLAALSGVLSRELHAPMVGVPTRLAGPGSLPGFAGLR